MTDEFIGKRFGKNQQIEVLSFLEYRRGKRDKMYLIKCHVCAQDSELWGAAIFEYNKYHLISGKIPCGCSNLVYWTKEQYEVRIERLCSKIGNCKFLGWFEVYKNNTSKIMIQCTAGSHIESVTVAGFLKGRNCLACANKLSKIRYTKSDSCMISNFLKNPAFADGTTFERSDKTDILGRPVYWKYRCPICSDDEYVKSGLCDGSFEATYGNLSSGKLSCRCSKHYNWSKQQNELRIIKELANDYKISFIGWLGDYKNLKSRIHLNCIEHGDWSTELSTFLYDKTGCSSCASTGYQPNQTGYLYVLYVQGVTNDFVGYGITNKIDNRLYTHKLNLAKYNFEIKNINIFKDDGKVIQAVEKCMKSKFEIYRQDVSGFKTEATYPNMYNQVLNYVKTKLELNNESLYEVI